MRLMHIPAAAPGRLWPRAGEKLRKQSYSRISGYGFIQISSSSSMVA